jgi:hypothetical protein
MEGLIDVLLETCKLAFFTESKGFKFFKFHMILHCPEQIRMFGNLDVMDANRQLPSNFIAFFIIFYFPKMSYSQVGGDAPPLRQAHL